MDYVRYVAGLLVVLSLLPQTLKSWSTKSTRDLSLWLLYRAFLGIVDFVFKD